jgi:hypothetical protein
MFYQNSNDLVKNASLKSGNVQHSRETQQLLASQQVMNPPNDGGAGAGAEVESRTGADGGAGASLSIGAQFQNMIQELVSAFSMKEGLVGGGGAATPADPSTGIGSNSQTGQANFINNQAVEDKNYTEQELNHINKTKGILDLIEKEDKTTRQNWVEVTDAVGVTKYGYITKDGVFQIWHAPSSPSANPANWLQTDKIKQNATTVIGCPASTSSIQKIKIAGKWDDIKPYDRVYSDADKSRTNPVFMMINNGVRDPRNTVGGKGLFSCGNESGNVYVTERPSADFQFPASGVDTIQIGCYVLGDNVTDSVLANRGFTYQEDLNEASISQCKRRAEDLGSSYFLISAPEKDKPNNSGRCWIYTGSGKPNINGIMTFDEKGSKCHTMSNQEDDEDHYLKEYTTTNLKRMYGKNTTLQFPLNPPNPECDHTTRNRCIFKDYHHIGGAICYPKNWNGRWAYGGLYNYSKQDLKGWLQALHDRNADDLERAAVNEYIEKCKRTQGYELLDDNPQWRTKIVRSVALYSLKTGGPNGVDQVNRGGRGYVGRIAYIDHNGERHDYPASALSMMAPSKDQNGNTLPASYLNLGGYDTRSGESSYSLKEIKPGSFSEASNLLYKASRDGWSHAAFHQRCDNKGATYTRAILNDGRVLGAYTSLSWSSSVSNYQHDTTAFLYDGTTKFPSTNSVWGSGKYATYMNSGYYPTFGGGHDFYISGQNIYGNAYTFTTSDGDAPFGRKRRQHFHSGLRDLEVYSVDANTFPKTLEFARRLRTMPVGESITASFEKCSGMCDADEKCGGFVYTKGNADADGKCELKDRDKMYPVGLRVADPTKQLMLKVPTINETISDEACKVGNGAYTMINSAHYAHYPDTGSMTSNTKCNMRDIIPKEGSLKPSNLTSMFGAVDKAFADTNNNTAEYANQTAVPAPQPEMTGTITEGMTIQQKDASFYTDASNNYGQAMKGVQASLVKIANSKYQRERLLAMTEESNKNLISESYKFILWSILAILAVMALLKLKEMFGEDDADGDGGDGGDGGGLLATILGWFGVKSVSTNDIPDRTEDVKSALSSAGQQLSETGTNLATDITEGADNLVNSANNMATGVVEGATNLVDKAKETASNAIDQVGTAASSATSAIGIGSTSSAPAAAPSPTTGGRKTSSGSKSRKK